MNGQWLYSVLDANTFKLLTWSGSGIQTFNPRSAYGILVTRATNPFLFDLTKPITSSVEYITEHKVGRPRAVLPGRRTIRR